MAVDCLELLEKMAPPRIDSEATLANYAGGDVSQASATFAGQSFGKYRVECELGRGGMGVVFKAWQQDLERPVALKMILSSQLASAEHLGRFQNEAKAAARLHHPNIVAVYEAGQFGGQPYFAMQLIAGPSLAQRLRAAPLSAEETARVVLAVARAVAHLHEHNIVHRDLKPANILLDNAGTPYVTDFGLVKMLVGASHHTSTGVIIGTPSYMSPEQASGRADQVGPPSDIHSLGAVLYEMLAGRPPFLEATPLDTLVQVLEGEPKLPRSLNPGVPVELETICLHCLEKNPADRYPSAAALADDLERYLKKEEINGHQPPISRRLRRWARREPALASRSVTLTICLVLVQVSAFFQTVPLALHLTVMGILAVWLGLSVICQAAMLRERWTEAVRFLWAAMDVILFTGLIFVDDALFNPVLIGYPLLIAASGLWFRVPLIWFTAAVAELSYVVLLAEWFFRHGAFQGLHKHVMFMVGLAVMAFVVSYQVKRVRALSQYYEHRPFV